MKWIPEIKELFKSVQKIPKKSKKNPVWYDEAAAIERETWETLNYPEDKK